MKLRKILKAVSQVTGIKTVFLKAKNRNDEYVVARNIYYKIAIDTKKFSVTAIGRKVNRTHATVIWGLSTFSTDYENNRLMTREMYHKVFELLKPNKNKDIYEWLLDEGIEPNTVIYVDGQELFLSDILEKHLKYQFTENVIRETKLIFKKGLSNIKTFRTLKEIKGIYDNKEDV